VRKKSAFVIPEELWVKTVYEFAAAYHKSVISRDHIIQALAPLFRGRVFTFLAENSNGSAANVEGNIEALCLEFERNETVSAGDMERWRVRSTCGK
jgi:hypothetical protein